MCSENLKTIIVLKNERMIFVHVIMSKIFTRKFTDDKKFTHGDMNKSLT